MAHEPALTPSLSDWMLSMSHQSRVAGLRLFFRQSLRHDDGVSRHPGEMPGPGRTQESLRAAALLAVAVFSLFGAPAARPEPAPAPRPVAAASDPDPATNPVTPTESLASALTPQAWTRVEGAIDRALDWLSRQQNRDGSFAAPDSAQPAATSLAIMAYLSRGHLPGEGPYGPLLDHGIDFVVHCQHPNGMLALAGAGSSSTGKTANYNHAIAALMLTEVYGMTDPTRAARLKPAILAALEFTRQNQTQPKDDPTDRGAWRYLGAASRSDSDLSVTAWQIMFLRSAKNAEFDVPKQFIDDAIGFVRRCWDDSQGIFYYKKSGTEHRWSRGMFGAGILSLAMAGEHQTRIAQRAGDWLLGHPYRRFGEQIGSGDRFFYSTYYCSQAMAQLGGRHWNQFFPAMVNALLAGQRASGDWPPEPYGSDRNFGNAYTTAMAVLSLTPPLQLLPVYQR